MKKMVCAASSVLLGCMIAAGCAHRPDAWTLDAIGKMQCGMSIDDVRQVLHEEPRAPSGRGPHGSHLIRRGQHALWFDFVELSLVAVQPAWTSALMRDENGERIELCNP